MVTSTKLKHTFTILFGIIGGFIATYLIYDYLQNPPFHSPNGWYGPDDFSLILSILGSGVGVFVGSLFGVCIDLFIKYR